MTTPKQIRMYNDWLRQAFGSTPYGEGLFAWMHGDRDLQITVPDAKSVYDGDWGELSSGILVRNLVPSVKLHLGYTPQLDFRRKWVVCRRELPSKMDWIGLYGTEHLWPERGYWIPTGWVTEDDVLPVDADTQGFILQWKKFLAQGGAKAYIQRVNDRQAQVDKENSTKRREMFADAMPAFMKVPGQRGGNLVSIGGIGEGTRATRNERNNDAKTV